MAFGAGRARRFFGLFIVGNIVALRITCAPDKHPVATIAHYQRLATQRAGTVFEHLDIMVIMMGDGANIIARGITGTTKERARLTVFDHQFRATLGAYFVLPLQGMLVCIKQ
jgi:hypothetical protein